MFNIIVILIVIYFIFELICNKKEKFNIINYKNIYDHKDSKKFDKNNLINPNTDTYNKMLEWFDNFSEKHNINYSIAYGTLLGQIRNKNYIPYDDDTDIFIGKDDIYKLFDLYKNAKKIGIENDIYVNSKLKENNQKILNDRPIIILTSEHEKKMNDKDRKRWNCNGEEVNIMTDKCAFNGPAARIIYNHKQCDIFVWSNSKEQLDNEYCEDCKKGKISDNIYCGYTASQYCTKLPKTKKCKLNSINVRKFKDKKLIKDNMIRWYGKNYLEPNQKFLDNKLVNL